MKDQRAGGKVSVMRNLAMLFALWSTTALADPPEDETIYVVEAKPFLVAGDLELAPMFAQSVNDSFTSHTGLVLSGIYHYRENVAFELTAGAFGWFDDGLRLGGRHSEETLELRDLEHVQPERVKLYEFPWLVAADAQWSPMYGKVSLQDAVLGQFNLYLSVGAAALGLKLRAETQIGAAPLDVEVPMPLAPSTSFGGGLRFYFTDWLGVRVDVRDFVVPLAERTDERGPSFDVTNLVLAQAGVSFKL